MYAVHYCSNTNSNIRGPECRSGDTPLYKGKRKVLYMAYSDKVLDHFENPKILEALIKLTRVLVQDWLAHPNVVM